MKRMLRKTPFILVAGLLLFTSCEEDDTTPNGLYTDRLASDVKMDIVADASISPYAGIFDVSPSYDEGHLPFATNAGSVSGLGDMLDDLDKDNTYLVYCHGDGPSIQAANLMTENGFTNVYRLEGNYGAWNAISFVDIAPAEVKSKIGADDFEAIFDVSPSYNNGHLPGATNANASGGGTDLSGLIVGMDQSKSYLVYCHGDGPAMAGAQLMEDAGFENVFRLEGNYGAWGDVGYAVEQFHLTYKKETAPCDKHGAVCF
jgi:rhodanese-related sulfurtransferase